MTDQPFSNASAIIPARYARKFLVVPLKLDNGVLHVAHRQDVGGDVLGELSLLLGLPVTGEPYAEDRLSNLGKETGYGFREYTT